MACLFLPVRINGDIALLKGIMKEMLEEDERTGGKVLAHEFIEQQTEGFEAFAADLRQRAGTASSNRAASVASRFARRPRSPSTPSG